MKTETIKITSKGQITIPKKVREFLQSDIITFEIKDDQVILRPITSVAGTLQDYNKNAGSWEEIRNKAWNEVIRDRQQ